VIVAKQFKVYIDYDEDPEIGGQQGVFFLDGPGHAHDFDDLIGARIVKTEFNEEVLDASRSPAEGRVLILTLEKTDIT
jgi:hypothetical protein